ncbi:hypothetical protein TTRE_0000464101 [Trichuris trichiura]|uniref:Uncharacterized protein n=1 Tax=Trichuris trichiura TaxID=36087 RepID=A0A077Z9A5_TRITR|nr:hypothetical protein TTRE_0000464101 [Trichuris trichiura]
MVPYQVHSDRGLRGRFQRWKRYLVPKVPALNPDQHVLDWALMEGKAPVDLTPSEYDFQVLSQSVRYSEKGKDIILPREADQRFKDKQMELTNSRLSPAKHITILGSESGPRHKHLHGKEYAVNNWQQQEELLSLDKLDEMVTVLGNGAVSDRRKHQKQNENTPIQEKESLINPKQSSVQKILDSRGKPKTKLPTNKISKKYSLDRMKNATVIVQLSSPGQNWLSIYDHCKEITLAKINISGSDMSLSGPGPQNQRNLSRRIIDHSVGVGNVVSLNCNTILLTDFTFIPKAKSTDSALPVHQERRAREEIIISNVCSNMENALTTCKSGRYQDDKAWYILKGLFGLQHVNWKDAVVLKFTCGQRPVCQSNPRSTFLKTHSQKFVVILKLMEELLSADAEPKIKLDIIDSKASDPSAAVSRHQNEDILLELPPGTNVAGVKWIHLYDPRAAATLASFQLSNAGELPCLN